MGCKKPRTGGTAHTSPCLRKNTSWNCGDEGRRNEHRMESTGRKGAVGSSHPCPPTTRTPRIQKKTARLNPQA